MDIRDSAERHLRDQLREAWRQIADLQWQLQTEQRNNKRQERVIASEHDALIVAREEHENAMADRDQEFADLEDAHAMEAIDWENERKAARTQAEPVSTEVEDVQLGRLKRGDLGLLHEFLLTCGQAPENADIQQELLDWAQRCSVVLRERSMR